MKKFFKPFNVAFTILFMTISLANKLQAQNYAWSQSIGDASADQANAIAVDASGNVYITGSFQGTADFDPSAGTANLTSAGNTDIFICKFDANGNYIWAKRMGNTLADISYSIAVDASGNVYTTGYFQGTTDFDPNAGTANLTSAGNNDIFVSKLDASGNYVWAKTIGNTGADIGYSITVDASGNVYTTGYFEGTTDFNPNAGTANLTSAGNNDIFVSKLDASGNYVWAKRMGSTLADISYSITVDASGNVYTTGYFQGTTDFDPNAGTANLTSAGNNDIFVSKLDASGNYVWAKRMGSTLADISYSIAVDASGNVYTTGYFQGTTDFDPNAGTANLTTVGNNDIFISKLDASGNYVWAKNIGSTSADQGYGIAVDASGNVYTTGYYQGTTDFDPNVGTANLTAAGNNELFISKLDASGNYVLAKSIGSTSTDIGYGIALDAANNIHITGSFRGTVDFDPSLCTSNMNATGNADIFVCKLSNTCKPPIAYPLTGGGPYCANATGVAVGLSNSEACVTYQLQLNGSNDGAAVQGTDSPISFGTKTAVGTYTVVATRTEGGCTANMTGSVSVTINPIPTPTIINTIIACGSVSVTATGGTSYAWSGGNSPSTATNTFTTSNTYVVTVTASNGCTASSSNTISPSNLLASGNIELSPSTSGSGTLQLQNACEDGNWTYYENPSNPGKYLFAINWNPDGNTALNASQKAVTVNPSASAFGVFLDNKSPITGTAAIAANPPSYNVGNGTIGWYESTRPSTSEASFTMQRYWNVNVGGGALPEPVNIRFYFDPNEYDAVVNAANAWSLTNGGYVEGPKWFKTISAPDGVNNLWNPGSDLSPISAEHSGWVMELSPAAFGFNNGVRYVQFDGITSFSGGGLAVGVGNGSVLPLDLLHFTGTEEEGISHLSWSTANERNTSHFVIERSRNGINFKTIGQIPAAGNSNETLVYNFSDTNPMSGDNYYRLRLVDLDETFTYSNTIALKHDVDFGVNIAPNPFQSSFTVDIVSTQNNNSEATIELFDMLGRQVSNTQVNINKGSNIFTLDNANLLTGTYMLKVTLGTYTTVYKIVKDVE